MKILTERRFEQELRKERERVEEEERRWREMRDLDERLCELRIKVDKLNWAAEKCGLFTGAELAEQGKLDYSKIMVEK